MNGNIIELSYSCFGDSSHFIIWYEDENNENRVYTSGGKVICFPSEEQTRQKAREFDINITDTCFYDVERLIYWFSMHQKEIDCRFLIDFWNFFSDIAYSIGKELEPVRTRLSTVAIINFSGGLICLLLLRRTANMNRFLQKGKES